METVGKIFKTEPEDVAAITELKSELSEEFPELDVIPELEPEDDSKKIDTKSKNKK